MIFNFVRCIYYLPSFIRVALTLEVLNLENIVKNKLQKNSNYVKSTHHFSQAYLIYLNHMKLLVINHITEIMN